MNRSTRVICIGNPYGGADAIGALVARMLRGEDLPEGVEILEVSGSGLSIIDLLYGASTVIFVDALLGGEKGRVRRIELYELLSMEEKPLISTHELDLLSSVEILRISDPDMAPERIYVIGVEIGDRIPMLGEPYENWMEGAARKAVELLLSSIRGADPLEKG